MIWVIVFGLLCSFTVAEETYDFIVVGGGTAGCVVGSRLSENGKHGVLILESGNVPHPAYDVPALGLQLLKNTLEDTHIYKTTPQDRVASMNNGVLPYIVGRALGGTSSINAMLFNRGSPRDYDNWAEITGDSSWNYENMLEFFKKTEDYHGEYPSEEHGIGGPITISKPDYTPGLDEWLEAGRHLGYPILDPNGPQQISFGANEFSKKKGHRASSYTGYIKPFLNSRPNLRLITNAEVIRVILDGDKAIGVNYSAVTGNVFVRARKEIIISAGVIESPRLLMRSGIARREVLKKIRVPQVKDLPVGENLQDHLYVTIPILINDSTKVYLPERDLTRETFLYYNKTGDGPYSTENGNFGQAFVSSSKSSGTSSTWANIQIVSVNTRISHLRFSGDDKLDENKVLISCAVILTRPKSRGTITLGSSTEPLIDFQYLSHPYDVPTWIEGIRVALQIYEATPSHQNIGAKLFLHKDSVPACSKHEFRSYSYWECYVGQYGASGMHGAGSCRMGRGEKDPKAVVDPQLKVIGVENLRVCDTSVMPQVTNANTQAAVYAIAEKLAKTLLKKWD